MKNNSGRPRKVRIKHGGRRHPKSGRPNWNRKEHRGTGPTLESEWAMNTDYTELKGANWLSIHRDRT